MHAHPSHIIDDLPLTSKAVPHYSDKTTIEETDNIAAASFGASFPLRLHFSSSSPESATMSRARRPSTDDDAVLASTAVYSDLGSSGFVGASATQDRQQLAALASVFSTHQKPAPATGVGHRDPLGALGTTEGTAAPKPVLRFGRQRASSGAGLSSSASGAAEGGRHRAATSAAATNLSSTYNARLPLDVAALLASSDSDDDYNHRLGATAGGGRREGSVGHSYGGSSNGMPFTSDAEYASLSAAGAASGSAAFGGASGAHHHHSTGGRERDRSISAASTAATAAFSEAELRYFRKLFEKFDIDKSGSLGFVEIKAMCRHLGVEITDDELYDSIDEIDDNGNGELEFDEFTDWLASMGSGSSPTSMGDYQNNASFGAASAQSGGRSASSQPRGGSTHDAWAIVKSKIRAKGANPLTNQQITNFKEIFDHFDVNRSGTICRDELRAVFVAMGRDDVPDEEIDEIMAEVDDDRSGEIDFDEFLMLMCLGFSQGSGGMGEDGSQSIEDYIRAAFEGCDPYRSDTISIDDLRALMLGMCGGEMAEAEVNEIIRGCPKDSHNRVLYAEWKGLWEACQGAC